MAILEIMGACVGILGCYVLGKSLSRVCRDVNALIKHSPDSDLEELDRPSYGVQWGFVMIAFALVAILLSRLVAT